jgi:hypothetical protein
LTPATRPEYRPPQPRKGIPNASCRLARCPRHGLRRGARPDRRRRLGGSLPLNVAKIGIKLNFAKPAKDSITLTALLALDPAFDPTGQSVAVGVGGVLRTFTLDAKGKSKVGYDQVQVKLVRKDGVVQGQLTLKVAQASLAQDFLDEGLTDDDIVKQARTVVLRVDLAGGAYGAAKTITYSAKKGKTGSAK